MGIKSYEEMNEMEKQTLEEYQQVFAAADITIDDLKRIIPEQIERLREREEQFDIPDKESLFLKARIRNMKMLETFIFGPEKAKQRLEAEMKSKIKSK